MEATQLKIKLNFKQLTSIVKQLSASEKMKLNEAIWDEKMDIPIEHQRLVMERIKKAKQDPTRSLNWEKAIKQLKP
jgi:hypothetical protein